MPDRPSLRLFTSYAILFKWLTLHPDFLNWKSVLILQQLWTILGMRSVDVEPSYHPTVPIYAPTHLSINEVLAKWVMTVPYKSGVETKLILMNPSLASFFFSNLDPRKRKSLIGQALGGFHACQGLGNPKKSPNLLDSV